MQITSQEESHDGDDHNNKRVPRALITFVCYARNSGMAAYGGEMSVNLNRVMVQDH